MSLKTVTAVAGMLALACAGAVFGAQKKPFLSTYRWGTGGCEKGLYDQWEQWVGGPVWAEDFMPKDAWNKIEGEAWQLGVWSKWRTFAPGRRLVLSVPMLVGPWDRSGPKTGPHAGEPVSLAKGAAGEYDAHFEVLGRNLVKWGLADTIVRLGWEFNGGWYTYRAENEQEARDFAAFFRRAVDAMRKAEGQKFLFCWNPAMEPHWNYDIEAAWPGDDHVDIIGLDVYDQSWVPDTYPIPKDATREERVARQDRAWKLKTANEKAFGLTWWPAFARRHGNKPLAICEWGVCHRDDGHGGEDDPLFIDRMADFIQDPANNVLFQCYFDVGADDGNHQLIPDGKNKICFPESTAAFHKRFAKPGTPAVPPPFKSIWTKPADRSRQNEVGADVVIYGSSPAALTAAIEAQRHGKSAVIVCPETRIGGLTTGGLGQTDIGNKDAFGGLSLQFYRDVADWYRSEANWKYEKREDYMPDGQCADSVAKDSMWTFEPSAALAILERWERQNRLKIFRGEFLDRKSGVVKDGARIGAIKTLSGKIFRGSMFVDATYEGDLMAAAGVSYTVGREANAVYGETISGVQRKRATHHQFNKGVSAYVKPGDPSSGLLPFVEQDTDAPDGAGDRRVQAYCFRSCLTDDPSNRIPFAKPEGYNPLNYELLLRNLEAIDPKTFVEKKDTPWEFMPWINSRMPNRKTDTNNRTGFSTDFVGQNWNWPEASYEERAKILKAHLDYQRGLFWTLANNPRVPEPIRSEVSKWGTCKDEFADGLGQGWQSQLYVREGRRMIGDYVVTEHDVLRKRVTSRPVAMAAYGMDSHNVRRYVDKKGFVRNEGNIEDWRAGGKPYPIDYGAILPKKGECENLFVPVCVSASHMAFGSIRMEPVFFALGQAAGAAASLSVDSGCAVQDLEYAKLRDVLVSEGVGLGVESRITELISRMTLDEKIGQLSQTNGGNPDDAQSEDMSEAPLDADFLAKVKAGRYGSLLGKRGARNYNILQETAMSGRLGIPLLVGHDMIHSSRTCFPIPLALSCAFDEDLWSRIGEAIAVESLTVGCNWTFTPMIDIARDARWGRIAESAGSDPLVTSRFGAAMVRGLQGDDLADGRHIAACAKHYVAYGAPLGGRDYNAVELSDATLRDVYLPPFRAAVAAGVATVMPAFHSFNDVPCSMNAYLLRDILRGEMGFTGMTISDWEAVGELVPHGVAKPGADAAAKALNAGMDMEMVSTHYADGLAEAVEKGMVSVETLDAAVRNVLRLKFRLGLFDHPTIDAQALEKTVDFAAHRALAREAAAKSCVLLKNGGVLPLKAPRVALIGDIAVNSRQMQGTWSTFDFSNTTNDTLLAGLLADGVSVAYTEAYTLTGRVDRAAIERACAEADAVIACFGDYLEKTGENNSSARIELPGEQLAVVDAVKACGKPLVAVVFGGRPLAIPELAEKADAVVMAWNPGGAGGWGVADVLTGAAEPYGRLTTDFPNATGECPKFYNRTTTGRHHVPGGRWTTRYNDVPFASVYPFGYGLAYTTFEYGGERVAVDGAEVVFSADITNTGSRGGSELVQVYTRDVLARTVRPRRELKGYQRVELAPGETKRVEIRVPVATLGYTVDKVYRVEPGEFEAWIAPDSDSGRKLSFAL